MSLGTASFIALLAAMAAASGMSLPLKHLQSGKGTIHYFHPPDVVLDLRSASGKLNRIPLTYKLIDQQRRVAIFDAEVIAEEKGHFLIFTDRFTSNSNVQGECGATDDSGDDGEEFIHVVSLAPPMKETLSVNFRSCYQAIQPVRGYPKYDPATHILSVKIDHEDSYDNQTLTRYRISVDGSTEKLN